MSRQTNLGGTETWTNSHNELKPKFFLVCFGIVYLILVLGFFVFNNFPSNLIILQFSDF